MDITSATFVRGVVGSTPFLSREGARPQVVFAGRSNVGKSSVINSLTRRTSLVKTSSTPGKTLQINFFLINESFFFVDLPGYGYAKTSQRAREKLRRMIVWFLSAPEETRIAALVLIVDAKASLRPFDRDLLAIAKEEGHRVIIVMNKMDKLNQKQRVAAERALYNDPAVRALPEETPIIFYSARTGRNRSALLNAIHSAVVCYTEK